VSAYEAANGGFGDDGFGDDGFGGSSRSAWFGTAAPVAGAAPAPAPAAAPATVPAQTAGGSTSPTYDLRPGANRVGGTPASSHDFGAETNGVGDPAAFGGGTPAGSQDFGAASGVTFADPGFADGGAFGAAANGLAFGDHTPPPHAEPGPGTLRLVAVTAGLGQPSTARILADRLAEAAGARLGERGRQVWVEVLELRDLALDIAGAMVAGFPGAKLRAALDAVEKADGLIAVSPIYTASYSGLFKSFFDVLDKDALTGKPTLIAATGGTSRHSLALDHALRPMFAYLRAFIVPTAVFAASEDWASAGEMSLNERIERAGTELGDLMAGTPASAARKPRDEFEDVVPFEQRMAALRSGI
jgi:FMN reductase